MADSASYDLPPLPVPALKVAVYEVFAPGVVMACDFAPPSDHEENVSLVPPIDSSAPSMAQDSILRW